jgi:hypothetical protein
MNKKNHMYVWAIAIIVVLAGVGYFSFNKDQSEGSPTSPFFTIATTTVTHRPIYKDPIMGFSFKYPRDFTVEAEGDGNDRFIIVTQIASTSLSSTTSLAPTGVFQLEARPWTDPDPAITVERIKHDTPDIEIRDPQPVSVAGQVRGVSFISRVQGIDEDVRQVWFRGHRYVYQFTSPIESDHFVQALLPTFMLAPY